MQLKFKREHFKIQKFVYIRHILLTIPLKRVLTKKKSIVTNSNLIFLPFETRIFERIF